MHASEGDAPDEVTRRATERWLLRRGLPHLIEGYEARTDIWTRALPVLVLVFVIEALNAVNLDDDWPVWANVAAPVGAFALLVATWAVVNRIRVRPALARPDAVGRWEVAVFLLGPPAIPLVFGGQSGVAVATFAANLVVLALVYLVTSYGIVPMVRWGAGQVVAQLLDVVGVVLRALPLMLLVVTFLFVNAEAWQVASSLVWPAVVAVAGLFFVVGAAFAALRVPREVGELADPVRSRTELAALVVGTPASALVARVPDPLPDPPPLTRRQWGNVGLVVLVSQAVQVVLVVAGVFAFFAAFGFLAISPAVVETWTGAEPSRLLSVTLGGHEMVLTRELVKVAAFLAAFSGLAFTVSLLTDRAYRAEFLGDVVAEVRQSLAVRSVYVVALTAGGTGTGTGTGPTGASGTISPT